MGAQAQLGEPLWRPPAPNGYSDREAAWIDGVPHRLDLANQFANRLAMAMDPLGMLDSALGPLASTHTRDTVARAESRAQALALLVMSPRIPAEMIMHIALIPVAPRHYCSPPERCSPGRYLPKAGTRRGPRSALSHHRPARRARWTRDRRAGRRSGLGGAARRQGAHARRQDAGSQARQFLRAQSGNAEPASHVPGPTKRSSSTPRPRPTASARISTARICWKAA